MYIEKAVAANETLYRDGYHLIGHSQGGLLTRCLLEVWPRHRVRNYISLSGVQNGEYGSVPRSCCRQPIAFFCHAPALLLLLGFLCVSSVELLGQCLPSTLAMLAHTHSIATLVSCFLAVIKIYYHYYRSLPLPLPLLLLVVIVVAMIAMVVVVVVGWFRSLV